MKLTEEQAKKIVRDGLASYLKTQHGLTESDLRKNIKCLNPQHQDNHPSMSYYLDSASGVHKLFCHACKANYDTFDLIAQDYSLQGADVFKKAYELFDLQVEKNTTKSTSPTQSQATKSEQPKHSAKQDNLLDFFLECRDHLQESSYLTDRGISYETQEKYLCGYCKEWQHPNLDPKKANYVPKTPRFIIPTGAGSYLARDTRKNLTDEQKQYSKQKVGKTVLFNSFALKRTGAKTVFIVEGEIDALSIIDLGFDAIALGSVSNTRLLLQEIKRIDLEKKNFTDDEIKKQIDHHTDLNLGDDFPTLVLALDNDHAGIAGTLDLIDAFIKMGVNYHSAQVSDLFLGCKDANEALQKDREAFRQKLERLTKSKEELYAEKSAKSLLAEFERDMINNNNPKPISTGFALLDKALDGGLFAGLYIIGAISSLGKTTFALQMADNIAKSGHDVLIISLEMAKRELLAKSISRLTLQNLDNLENLETKARSVRDLTTYINQNSNEQHDIIQQSLREYDAFAEHVFIIEGLMDVDVHKIRQAVEEHTLCRGHPPVVIIDYLQIIEPEEDDKRATDKQKTDNAVKALKIISRDFKTPVIAISSLNRQNYNEPISMLAFKESGAIEYSSDTLLGLQLHGAGNKDFDVDVAKKLNPRQIELKILKNRNGQTGAKLSFVFYAKYNYFEERLSLG